MKLERQFEPVLIYTCTKIDSCFIKFLSNEQYNILSIKVYI